MQGGQSSLSALATTVGRQVMSAATARAGLANVHPPGLRHPYTHVRIWPLDQARLPSPEQRPVPPRDWLQEPSARSLRAGGRPSAVGHRELDDPSHEHGSPRWAILATSSFVLGRHVGTASQAAQRRSRRTDESLVFLHAAWFDRSTTQGPNGPSLVGAFGDASRKNGPDRRSSTISVPQ